MYMEETAAQNIIRVVGILTAILSGQEDEAYSMVLEGDPTELFSALTGLLLSTLNTVAEREGKDVQDYLQELGITAARSL